MEPNINDKKIKYTWQEFDIDIEKLIIKLKERKISYIYPIMRGGMVIAVKLSNKLKIPIITNLEEGKQKLKHDWNNDKNEWKEILVVDDISDSGKTFLNITEIQFFTTLTLFLKEGTQFIPNIYINKCEQNEWIEFCWE